MEKAVKSKKAMEKASPEALRLAQQQETKKPGRERASLCPDQSQVGEDAHEDVETDVSHRRVHRIDHIKKARRSSFKKFLISKSYSLFHLLRIPINIIPVTLQQYKCHHSDQRKSIKTLFRNFLCQYS